MATASLRLTGNVIFNNATGNARMQMEQIGFPAYVISTGRLDNARLPLEPSITGNLTPTSNILYSLGNATHRWKDLYLAGNTLFLGNSVISESSGGGIAINAGSAVALGQTRVLGNLVVEGNLTVLGGNVVEIQTETQITDQLIVTNAGTGPALIVEQTGSEDIATFKDDGNVVVRIHDGSGAMSVGGDVAVPLGALHVVGNVYASGTYVGNGASLTSLNASAVTTGTQVRVGEGAGLTGQGSSSVAIGLNAGKTSQGLSAVAIGLNAGSNAQGFTAVAIGEGAGQTSQGSTCVAVGKSAGSNAQGANSTAIGSEAGSDSQRESATAVGFRAGKTSQGVSSVAVGRNAGNVSQSDYSVAVGFFAGDTSQGTISVAIGREAGETLQGSSSVAVGYAAGQMSQGIGAVAMGSLAGMAYQGNLAVAIGRSAAGSPSQLVGQGSNAIAIGYAAGYSNQAANSIVINATGAVLNNTTADSCVIKPVRSLIGSTFGTSRRDVMLYDETSGEVQITPDVLSIDPVANVMTLSVMQGFGTSGEIRFGRRDGAGRYHSIKTYNTSVGSSNTMTLAVHEGTVGNVVDVMTLRGDGNVGIGTTAPAYTLDVTGTGRFTGTLGAPLGSATAPSIYFGTDTNTGIYSPSADTLNLTTAGTAAVSIDAVGTVDITSSLVLGYNGSAYTAGEHVGYAHAGGSTHYTYFCGRNVADTSPVFYARVNNAAKFYVEADGSVHAVTTTIAAISDENLKRDISDAHSQWDDMKAIAWRRFRYKTDVEEKGEERAKYHLGIIAQEIQDICPNVVETKYVRDENGKETEEFSHYEANYAALWMKSAACLKEAILRIEALEDENAALKSRVDSFESRLAVLEGASSAAPPPS
jgi:hypothetical protein